ncbi:hypothetical protein AB834_02800 [PVC group bacterium (ex Bugula neritina AB1)]|nr:hypothetical protein AB834_02800 [PVC group bacterium (ex Bugula neritina AB1)]
MAKIIACIDGSSYVESVTELSTWAHKQMNLPISLLHILPLNSEKKEKPNLTGQLGFSAKSNLLEELTKRDETRGKLEIEKGERVLDDAKEEFSKKGITQLKILHRRGSLVENIKELETQAELIIMGKRGENHPVDSDDLGSNLECVARAIDKPLLLATPKSKSLNKFLIAYDGSSSANKAVDYVATHSLLKGLECHLLKIAEPLPEEQKLFAKAENKLKSSDIRVHSLLKQGNSVNGMVTDYIKNNDIDLLLMGAYGHSKIRNLFFGSMTTLLLRESNIPIMLFR